MDGAVRELQSKANVTNTIIVPIFIVLCMKFKRNQASYGLQPHAKYGEMHYEGQIFHEKC